MEIKATNNLEELLKDVRYKPVYDFIKSNDMLALEKGKHEIADGVFVIISEYETKENKPLEYEAHRIYDDIQMIIKGEENIKCDNIEDCAPITLYDETGDYQMLKSTNGKDVILRAGDFLILPPWCAHLPGCAVEKSGPVKKAVFKVKI